MAGRKRSAPVEASTRTTRASARAASQNAAGRPGTQRKPAGRSADLPDVYREMLVEARSEFTSRDATVAERPFKRKRPGEGRPVRAEQQQKEGVVAKTRAPGNRKPNPEDILGPDTSNDDNIDFEGVVLPTATVQTIVRESEDEDDDGEIDFEDVAIEPARSSAAGAGEESKRLNLDLSAHMAAMTQRRADRRRAISREEKERRVEVHKIHLVCLLAHVELRNRWCNDPHVQDALRPLLPPKTVAALLPRASLNQFGRTESLRKGLQEAKDLFKLRFAITERGLRRALWAEDEEQLKSYELPDDIESTLEKSDFLEAARTLHGSRDVGAQLFCALLRSVGVEARLVCSLQPLSCVAGAPPMPKQQTPKKQPSRAEVYAAAMARQESQFPEFQAGATTPSPRRRLGHPHATAYHVPSMSASPQPPPAPPAQTPRRIRGESPFPVYWVEVLDVAHQKWQPVDPLVTHTQWKPRALEPPASDPQNCMTYVFAFEADSSARDVTRRYTKAYNSKTRKLRIDGATATLTSSSTSTSTTSEKENARWYRRLLRRYTRPIPTDLDQIELNELAAEEAREPMPRNVADFKDHPVYALERHLRRHEVLVPGAEAIGTVSAGARAGAPMERIYRRRDVRVARTRERWYRLGRVVKDGEEAVKSLPKRKRRKGALDSDGDGEDNAYDDNDDDPDRVGLFGDATAGYSPLYMLEQTEAYVAPPVVNGRVPKNKFGNLDLYVPSMVPRGGVHIAHERAAQAAFILGVDYAPALTGFEFKGRHGTAVLNGVVVPQEAGDAVWAVIQGLVDMEAEEEQERRTRRALRMWSRFLKALRIRERIWAGVDEEAEAEVERERAETEDNSKGKGKEKQAVEEDDIGMEDAVSEDGMGGGGFFVPDEEDEDGGGGGGFLVE
ncbi:uncharacterized protein B0T15DRAFT_539653 [Chaetomium strumarium]|uniref:DNA repair protein n=1 Tax=Chaetomium strumarium TaxID=1170767 RepID=A0AAJ0LZC5_9PEZI|nr:hypothetical protein B0T15DRAFT_539653 [Chaetomium strumarium]